MDGVSGVIMKPISGAKQEGVEGFFKGVGKGVMGLVTRPTAGVIDFASGSFDAVKRYACCLVTKFRLVILNTSHSIYYHLEKVMCVSFVCKYID